MIDNKKQASRIRWALGVDVGVPGNWDFAYGPNVFRLRYVNNLTTFQKRLLEATVSITVKKPAFPNIAANMQSTMGANSGGLLLPGTLMKTVGGVKVGFIGLTSDIVAQMDSMLAMGMTFNDLWQGFTFGTNLNFSVSLDLPIPSLDAMVSGTAFSLSFYDTSYNSLLADPTWNAALVLDLKGSGEEEVLAKSNTVFLSTTAPVPVPLPGSIGLLLVGISALSLRFGNGRKKPI